MNMNMAKQKCKCGYEWMSRVENPIECPDCKKRLNKQNKKEVE